MFFSPSLFNCCGLETRRLTEAIRTGLSRVSHVEVALVADLVRDFGPENESSTLTALKEVRELGVIGIGIGGSEQEFPPELFQQLYEDAREMGFHTNAHAGETAGAESIWGVIRALRVDRIGHGTRAEEDNSLLDYLAERRIPLEMCPLSNLRTGVVKSFADHPVGRYFKHGMILTINTDDPKMFANSFAQEFQLIEEKLGVCRNEIRQLILNGIRAAWLTDIKKRQYTKAFCRDPVWQQDAFR
jgi:adenosine deaminase